MLRNYTTGSQFDYEQWNVHDTLNLSFFEIDNIISKIIYKLKYEGCAFDKLSEQEFMKYDSGTMVKGTLSVSSRYDI